MQSLCHALRDASLPTAQTARLIEEAKQLRAATYEVGLSGDPDQIVQGAKALWNAAVAHDASESVLPVKAELLAVCREIALLGLQHSIKSPWDDKTSVMLMEMSVRLAGAYRRLGDIGRFRLYMSKATEIMEELADKAILGPSVASHYHSAQSLYFAEAIIVELLNGSDDSFGCHQLDKAMDGLAEEFLPHFVTEMVRACSQIGSRTGFKAVLLRRLLGRIEPIESFPAHISEDLILSLVDLGLEGGNFAEPQRLLDHMNPNSPVYHVCQLKIILASGICEAQALADVAFKAFRSAKGVTEVCRMIAAAQGSKLLQATLQSIAEAQPCAVLALPQDARAEYVEIQVELALEEPEPSIPALHDLLVQNLDHLIGSLSKPRIQKQLCDKGERQYLASGFDSALRLFQMARMLCSESSELDAANRPKIERKIIMCLLELGRLAESEEAIFGYPSDIHGLTLRFLLAASRRNLSDGNARSLLGAPSVSVGSVFLDRLVALGADIDLLLSLANFCSKHGCTDLFLKVLQEALAHLDKDRCLQDFNLYVDILKSVISACHKVLKPGTARVEIVSQYLAKSLRISDVNMANDHRDYFFSISWNIALEAAELSLPAQAALGYFLAFKFLGGGSGRKQVKISTIISCLTNYCRIGEPESEPGVGVVTASKYDLVKGARDILDDIEISDTFLPSKEKRPEDPIAEQMLTAGFDPVKATRALDVIEFQLAFISGDVSACERSIDNLEQSARYQDVEQLVLWAVQKPTLITLARVMVRMLQLLVNKMIHKAPNDIDLRKFSFIYRGLALTSLQEERLVTDGPAMEYFRQALEIIRMYPEYPPEEVCWLAISSYNHAIGRSMIDIECAQRWCELSLSLCNHMGPLRDNYEGVIRNGYSQIIRHLTPIQS